MANFQKIPRLGFICSHSMFSLNYILGVRWGEGVRWRGGGGTLVGVGDLLDVGYVEGVRREDRSKTAEILLEKPFKNHRKK